MQTALADIVGTVVIFGFSLSSGNSSYYDAYWSVIPMALAGYLVYAGWDSGADPTRALLVAALVWYWGARLTHNWARGWQGLAQCEPALGQRLRGPASLGLGGHRRHHLDRRHQDGQRDP